MAIKVIARCAGRPQARVLLLKIALHGLKTINAAPVAMTENTMMLSVCISRLLMCWHHGAKSAIATMLLQGQRPILRSIMLSAVDGLNPLGKDAKRYYAHGRPPILIRSESLAAIAT